MTNPYASDPTLAKAYRLGADGVLLWGRRLGLLAGVVAGAVTGGLVGTWHWAVFGGYLGGVAMSMVGSGIAGCWTFRGIDPGEMGHAVNAIGFGVGAGIGTALGATWGPGVTAALASIRDNPGLPGVTGAGVGAFAGFVIGGTAVILGLARWYDGWEVPAFMGTWPVLFAGLGGLIGLAVASHTSMTVGIVVTVIGLLFGTALGQVSARAMLDPFPARDHDWPCGN